MKHSDAKLSRTLLLSLVFHAAVFGSALAFAHYGDIMPGESLRTIIVSLVGAGASEGVRQYPARPSIGVRRQPVRPSIQPAPAQALSGPVDAALAEPKPPDGEDHYDITPERSLSSGAGSGDSPAEEQGIGNSSITATGGAGGGIPQELMQHLKSAIEKAKTYPRFARERGIEGTVLVRFKVLPSGNVEAVNVVKSSGMQILDDASVSTVYRAAPMPYVKGWIEVPMVYELK